MALVTTTTALCNRHFDTADRRSEEHWSEGFDIEEDAPAES